MSVLLLTPHHSLIKQGWSYIQSFNYSLIYIFFYFRAWDLNDYKKKQHENTCYRIFQQTKVSSQAQHSGEWVSKTNVSKECARIQSSKSKLSFNTPKIEMNTGQFFHKEELHTDRTSKILLKITKMVLYMVAHVSLKTTLYIMLEININEDIISICS